MATVPADPEAWKRLGQLARQRRDELGLTQAEIGHQAGLAAQTVLRLESGKPATRHTSSWSKLERALGWMTGSVQAILEGGIPAIGSYDGRFLRIQVDYSGEIVHDLVRKISMAIDPDVPLSRLVRAEEIAGEALREAGLLPPLDKQGPEANHSNE